MENATNTETETKTVTARELEYVREEVARADIALLLRKVCTRHQCRAEIVKFPRGLFLVTLNRRDVAETGDVGGVVGDGYGQVGRYRRDAEANALPAMLRALAHGGWAAGPPTEDLVKAKNGHVCAAALVMRREREQ